MSQNPVFQLSMVSQNDQPNPSCPGCAAGKEIYGEVISAKIKGGTFLSKTDPIKNYPASNEPLDTMVHLPYPLVPAPPTPTWFFEITDGIENFSLKAIIQTAEAQTTTIHIDGANMPGWVKKNKKETTNQIYQTGNCGIFGFAQSNDQAGYTTWIYTLTAGVCNPQVHPSE